MLISLHCQNSYGYFFSPNGPHDAMGDQLPNNLALMMSNLLDPLKREKRSFYNVHFVSLLMGFSSLISNAMLVWFLVYIVYL